MSISTTGSFRIRNGIWVPADITTAYEVTAFPQQTDQPDHIEWIEPIDPSDVISPATDFVEGLDGTLGGFGGESVTWVMALLTPGMMEYWLETVLFPNGGYSDDVTIMTRDRKSYSGRWRILTGTVQYTDLRSQADPVHTGYYRIRTTFVNMKAAGRAFSDGFSAGFA